MLFLKWLKLATQLISFQNTVTLSMLTLILTGLTPQVDLRGLITIDRGRALLLLEDLAF